MMLHHKALVLYRYPLFTGSFTSLLKEIDFFDDILGCRRPEEVQELIADNNINYLFIDFNLPESDMLSFIRKVVADNSNTYIIVVSSQENDKIVFKIKEAGAHAFISKKSGKKEIQECLPVARAGGYYISPDVFNNALQLQLDNKKHVFTPKEHEILEHIISGKPTAEISALLDISLYTLMTHRRNMMKKANANNIAVLVKIALSKGLV